MKKVAKAMEIKDALALALSGIGVVIATISAAKALVEYHKQGVAKRSELFLNLRNRLRQDPDFKKICEHLESDAPELRDTPLVEKDRFLGFFEELAILWNSRLINEEVILYMFGYFAIRCKNSGNFWSNLNKDHNLWGLFFDFANQMEEAHASYKYDRSKLRV